MGFDKIRLTGSWANLVRKVFLSIVTFDQLGGSDGRLADWSGRLRKSCYQDQLEDRSQKKKIMFLHSKNKASRKGYKGEC